MVFNRGYRKFGKVWRMVGECNSVDEVWIKASRFRVLVKGIRFGSEFRWGIG